MKCTVSKVTESFRKPAMLNNAGHYTTDIDKHILFWI